MIKVSVISNEIPFHLSYEPGAGWVNVLVGEGLMQMSIGRFMAVGIPLVTELVEMLESEEAGDMYLDWKEAQDEMV